MSAVLEEVAAPPAHPLLGVHHGVPNVAYHGSPGISNSGLQNFAKSAAIYYGRHLDPLRPPPEEKAGQLEGNLAHCAILEPDQFGSRYAIGPTVRRNTTKWKDFVALNPDKVCIQVEQYDAAMRQADNVRKLPAMARALAKGAPEVSAYWKDPATGVLCRCRPDWVYPVDDSGVMLLDVKTYSSAEPEEFQRQVARKGYFIQDAFYSRGYAIAAEVEVYAFLFVAVETEWPYEPNVLMLDPESQAEGLREVDRLLPKYKQCLATNTWPGYCTPEHEISEITLPRYKFR